MLAVEFPSPCDGAEIAFLDHHDEKDPALVPPANPADAPAINVIANGDFSEEPQKLNLNLPGDPCMTLRGGTVKATATNFAFQQPSD